jgi:hypothetical protein
MEVKIKAPSVKTKGGSRDKKTEEKDEQISPRTYA